MRNGFNCRAFSIKVVVCAYGLVVFNRGDSMLTVSWQRDVEL
jgi:hypothetical protein